MGEQFLKKQAKGFRHRHDLARDRFATPDLLARMRTNGIASECTCRASGSARPPDIGAPVVLRAVDGACVHLSNDPRVDLLRGETIEWEAFETGRRRLLARLRG